jgi:hypothetical protein
MTHPPSVCYTVGVDPIRRRITERRWEKSMKQMPFGDPTQIRTPHTDDDWSRVLEEHDVQFVVLNQSQDEKLVKTLLRQPGWSVDFEGDGVVIFARSAQNRRRQ